VQNFSFTNKQNFSDVNYKLITVSGTLNLAYVFFKAFVIDPLIVLHCFNSHALQLMTTLFVHRNLTLLLTMICVHGSFSFVSEANITF